MSPLEERALHGGTELSFTGIDQDAQDEADIQNMAHGIPDSTPVRAPPRPRHWKISLAICLSFLVIATINLGILMSAAQPGIGSICALSLLGVLTLMGAFVGVQRLRRKRAPPPARYAMAFDGRTFTLATAKGTLLTLPEEDIIAFEGGPRIVLQRGNGTRVTLPCVMGDRDHAALVARLNEVLTQSKAEHAGYRGPRIGEGAPEDAIDIAVDEEEIADSARSGRR